MTEPAPTREQAEALDTPTAENLIAEIRKRTRIVDDGWWCLARDSELDSLAAAVSLLVTERDALREALEAIAVSHSWEPFEVWAERASAKAREALAGGGRTPPGGTFNRDLMSQDSGGGRSASAVAEARITGAERQSPQGSSVGSVGGPSASERPPGSPSEDAPAAPLSTTVTALKQSPPEPVSPGAADVAEAGGSV